MKKPIYIIILICCASMLALAGRNSNKCENEKKADVKKTIVIDKEDKASMPDLLSPLHLLVFSL